MEGDLKNIIETCNRKQITNLQIRCMITYLAQSCISFLPQKQNQIIIPNQETPKGQNFIEQQIQVVKEFVVKKLAAIQSLDFKVQKLNDITKKYIEQKVQKIQMEQVKIMNQLSKKANISSLQNQLKQIYLLFQQNEKKIQKDVYKKLKDEMKATSDKIQKKFKDLCQKIKQNEQNWKKLFVMISDDKTRVKHQNKMQEICQVLDITKLKQLQKIQDWVDPECHYFKRLKFEGSMATAIDEAAIFGKKKIGRFQAFSVEIKSMKSWIGIGVIDSQYKGKDVLVNQQRWISYGSSGRLYNGKQRKYQGLGFKVNEIVTIKVDKAQGVIQWIVGGELRHKLFSLQLRNQLVEWVPYIYMNSKNDCISVSE